MKRKSSSVSVKWSWLALSVALMAPTVVQATVKTAVEAMSCQPENNTCPYSFDLYKTDMVYKATVDAALKKNEFPTLLNDMNGPQGPMEPVQIDGKVYLRGSMCEDGDCGGHYYNFAYQPDSQDYVGYYFNGKGSWVNAPSRAMMKVLRGDISPAMPAEPAAPAATGNSAPPPNTIWGFTGSNGDTLWDMCGGKQNSCVIVGNTKHVVAVLNHKSATGCALGDFYIIDRDDNSWQQRDTGTCSPNAWVRKGSINGGQYLSVDIGVSDETVIQYPIGYWSDMKEFSGPNRPSWEKAKQAAKH